MSNGAFAQYGAYMLQGGYSPLPIRIGTKRPLFNEWDHLRSKTLTESEIAELVRRNPHLGLGVAGGYGGLVPVDVDTDDKEILRAVCSTIPRPVVAKVGQRGFTTFYWDGGAGDIDAGKHKQPLGDGKFQMLVEILTTGQSVVPPTIHPDLNKPYRWLTARTLFDLRVDELPVITKDHIESLKKALFPWIPENKKYTSSQVSVNFKPSSSRYAAYARAILASETRLLSSMSPKSGRNDALFIAACKVGKYVHHRIISATEVENSLLGACQSNGLWMDRDCGEKGCRATLRSGMNKSISDSLPELCSRDRRIVSGNSATQHV
jgi:hypothetical protein